MSHVSWSDVDAEVESARRTEADWVATQRRWGQGWRRHVLPGVLLAYLGYVGEAVAQNSRGAGAVGGYVILAVFAACYVAVLPMIEQAGPLRFWSLYGVLVAAALAELPFAHAAAFVMCVYIAIVTVGRLGAGSAPIVVALALAALLVPVAIPSWHDSIRDAVNTVTPLAIPVAALGVFAAIKLRQGNHALAQARSELAQLAAENERSRIARDLHDLLGHSLTTITVKAGLARRLGATDPARAVEEIAEVEDLSRQALAEVRAAVSSYRDVTLAGELARGRELLRASGVTADLPTATDVVDAAHQELLGWTVREGLTNVVRHAHASSCAVRLSPSSVEIVDDGIGRAAVPGNGLSGLRERIAAAGGVLEAGPLQPAGWRLRVLLEPERGR
jgi:two-component system, NarL family, sensor histidine kinase DesK